MPWEIHWPTYTIKAVNDGKDGCNTDQYITVFLHSDWLYFLWNGTKCDTRQFCCFRVLNIYFLCIFKIVVLSLILHQDTAGSERFESISALYYRGAKAAIVCYGRSQLRVFYCIDCGLGLNFRCAPGLATTE